MGKIVKHNQSCISTDCGSSDALQIYEEGDSFCFSCKNFFSKEETEAKAVSSPSPSPKLIQSFTPVLGLDDIGELPSRGFKERGITKHVCEFFGVKVSYDSDGQIDAHYYPYKVGNEYSYKTRRLPKHFSWVGQAGDLFGLDKFSPGGKRLVITEGEIDALSVAQSNADKYDGKIYPVIALPSGISTQKLLDHREWIRSFQEVVLCMDNDEVGREALEAALKIVGIDKAKIVSIPADCKDANDILIKYGSQRLTNAVWDAQPWSPAGIIRKEQLWDALVNYNQKESVPYPDCLTGLNKKLKGQRTGEIVLFTSGTGSGKSTIIKEVAINDLERTTDKIGVLALEESPAESARKYSGMAINKNPADEEIPIDELKIGFDKIFGEDRVLLLDHQGSINDDSLMNQLEYMALMGCKYIFIDHITILVSEGTDGLSGNEAIDKVMNDLLRLVKKFDVWIGLVSHLRKAPSGQASFESGKLPSLDDIRGSGSIKQVSFDIIAFARNLLAENDAERNTIKMAVLKSRYTGLTGSVRGAVYDHKTGRLSAEPEKLVGFTKIDE